MSRFDESRRKALAQLQQAHTCRVLTAGEVARRRLKEFAEVWLVDTEVFLPAGSVRPVQLLVGLPADFPLVLPTVYLERASYEQLRYLPHVDTNGLVCVYDPESVRVNPRDPAGIVHACVVGARRLLEQGLAGTNAADFQHEFVAYWENVYAPTDQVVTGLALLDDGRLPPGPCKVLQLRPAIGVYTLVLPGDEDAQRRFVAPLERQRIAVDTADAFHLGEMGHWEPPFDLTNGRAFAFVQEHFPGQQSAYIDFLRRSTGGALVLFHKHIGGQTRYFGWEHPQPQLNRPGFRPGKLRALDAWQTIERAKSLRRYTFDVLTPERLALRTAGHAPARAWSLLVAGLGSVGSNLVPYLDALAVREWRLVDDDVLTLANINRHLLGFHDVNQWKVEALRNYLERRQPLRAVSVRRASVVQVATDEPAYLNEADAVVLAIGKTNAEAFLVEQQRLGVLTRPLFVLWVEPYLAGGHLVYLPPGHHVDYASLFPDGYYRYNVLAAAEYQKPGNRLLLREAGCQVSYLPYSQEYLALFLARVFPEIRTLLLSPAPQAQAFTWLGNLDLVAGQALTLSPLAEGHREGELLRHAL